MNTKYDINEKVYTLYSNKIEVLKIKKITIYSKESIEYTMEKGEDTVYKNENQIFKTKDQLLASL
jgi:hypothetical protein